MRMLRFVKCRDVTPTQQSERGSVLIIVLWIAFGLVSVALYFGHSMLFEFRASDNNTAGLEAEQAIAGAARYVSFVLTNVATAGLTNSTLAGRVPDPQTYASDAVPLGDATFWLLGRSDLQQGQAGFDTPAFGLIDEASKLNLNTATLEMLEALPGMTPEVAAAIIDWRDSDSEVSQGGAESETYARLNPPYLCKNTNFDTVEELRLVFGVTPELLYGEDINRNGVLDANENDGNLSLPIDNRDGRLDPGILEYVTVFTRESNKREDGSNRVNVNGDQAQLSEVLTNALNNTQRVNEILARLGGATNLTSVLEFYVRTGMNESEFALVSDALTTTDNEYTEGLVNVNTASAVVLACIPGIGPDKAQELVAYRQSRSLDQLESIAWVKEVLDDAGATQAGRYLTTRSYQLSADILAVGHQGKGYRRTWFVFDTSEGDPKILYRRDLSNLGWALGTNVRENAGLLAKELR